MSFRRKPDQSEPFHIIIGKRFPDENLSGAYTEACLRFSGQASEYQMRCERGHGEESGADSVFGSQRNAFISKITDMLKKPGAGIYTNPEQTARDIADSIESELQKNLPDTQANVGGLFGSRFLFR